MCRADCRPQDASLDPEARCALHAPTLSGTVSILNYKYVTPARAEASGCATTAFESSSCNRSVNRLFTGAGAAAASRCRSAMVGSRAKPLISALPPTAASASIAETWAWSHRRERNTGSKTNRKWPLSHSCDPMMTIYRWFTVKKNRDSASRKWPVIRIFLVCSVDFTNMVSFKEIPCFYSDS